MSGAGIYKLKISWIFIKYNQCILVRNPAAVSRYPEPMWTTIEGRFVGVGALNTVPDGKYTHPSDGNMDLLVARYAVYAQ